MIELTEQQRRALDSHPEVPVRVMDPDYEGRNLLQILEWAEQNLDYLAWRDESTGAFIARPATSRTPMAS